MSYFMYRITVEVTEAADSMSMECIEAPTREVADAWAKYRTIDWWGPAYRTTDEGQWECTQGNAPNTYHDIMPKFLGEATPEEVAAYAKFENYWRVLDGTGGMPDYLPDLIEAVEFGGFDPTDETNKKNLIQHYGEGVYAQLLLETQDGNAN